MRKALNILDCTLRDGGYVNDWCFSEHSYYEVVEGLEKAQIEVIELGILGKSFGKQFATRFSDIKSIPTPIKKNKNTIYTVMGAYPEMSSIEFPNASDASIDAIRVAYFKQDYVESLNYAKELKEKGYKVFIQAMATFLYEPYELEEMLIEVNKLLPYAFYMVDSFGVMYGNDIRNMYKVIDDILDKRVAFGFHAHNNMQMALANSIEFAALAKKSGRLTFIDASLYGMGRGAGNTCLELLAGYFNEAYDMQYDIDLIMKIIQSEIIPIEREFGWGYSDIYYLIAREKVNSAYIWYFGNKGITDYVNIEKIIKKLPSDCRYTLKKDVVDSIIREVMGENE